jgi:hypothetical protein
MDSVGLCKIAHSDDPSQGRLGSAGQSGQNPQSSCVDGQQTISTSPGIHMHQQEAHALHLALGRVVQDNIQQ